MFVLHSSLLYLPDSPTVQWFVDVSNAMLFPWKTFIVQLYWHLAIKLYCIVWKNDNRLYVCASVHFSLIYFIIGNIKWTLTAHIFVFGIARDRSEVGIESGCFVREHLKSRPEVKTEPLRCIWLSAVPHSLQSLHYGFYNTLSPWLKKTTTKL